LKHFHKTKSEYHTAKDHPLICGFNYLQSRTQIWRRLRELASGYVEFKRFVWYDNRSIKYATSVELILCNMQKKIDVSAKTVFSFRYDGKNKSIVMARRVKLIWRVIRNTSYLHITHETSSGTDNYKNGYSANIPRSV
jgi:hypothetical protein